MQLIDAGVRALDAVLFTHDHADHTHGIDELRVIALLTRKRVPVWFDAATRESLEARFSYCFRTRPGSSYPPILELHLISPPTPVRIAGAGGTLEFWPVEAAHGDIVALGVPHW